MGQSLELNRRAFLKSAGVTAVLGAVGAKPALAIETTGAPSVLLYPTHDFDERFNRVGTDCSRWDGPIATYGEDIEVAMGIADMDFRTAPCVTRALAERCSHENWGYLRRPESFLQAIVDWNKRRYDLEVDPSTVVVNAGVHEGIIAALHTFAPPGSRVLMTTPTYNGFYSDLRFTRTVTDDSLMRLVDGRYSIDFEDFERRARRANVFILCNPQNPTGNVWSAEDMTRLGEICLEHRVVMLVDEIHCDFIRGDEKYIPFASLPNTQIVDNSITFKSASKSFSLSGIKVAWYFSSNRDYLERVRAHTRTGVNTLGVVATQAALTEGDEWLDELGVYLDGNHDFAEAYIKERMPLVKYTKAQGTYLAWLDVSEVVEKIGAESTAAEESASTGEQVTPERIVQRWFAENARVYLNPGSSYGTGGAGHMRMNLATTRRLVERALENMASALAKV
ncbi:MAG: aminotransferase class I/II-fold pyridoxal phosphate-dependent enzyme [Gemmatimonadetes bacterium]|nr:aminotransferase class I/II-fold pyridoxal phosphate-dependent enzyme [Gemmatimonadota bacterium]